MGCKNGTSSNFFYCNSLQLNIITKAIVWYDCQNQTNICAMDSSQRGGQQLVIIKAAMLAPRLNCRPPCYCACGGNCTRCWQPPSDRWQAPAVGEIKLLIGLPDLGSWGAGVTLAHASWWVLITYDQEMGLVSRTGVFLSAPLGSSWEDPRGA